ncbi:MAG: hypothetical protein M3072_05925 [Candidatus Dormibacteraeota bacterium]|nr:hypothetical protein [Candidatus Dormibacteraeota bacterium]
MGDYSHGHTEMTGSRESPLARALLILLVETGRRADDGCGYTQNRGGRAAFP